MPAVFFGHGTPMNALETNRYTAAWRTFGQTIPEATCDPRHLGPLVPERDRRDRDGAAAHDPRLLRLPEAPFRGRIPRAR